MSRRAETRDDEAFVRDLIVASAAEELGAISWPEPMRSHLLGIQYSSRRDSIKNNFPQAQSEIILFNNQPAGWMVLADTDDATWLVEILIATHLRGQGIGSAAIEQMLSETRKPVQLHVTVTNQAAIRLYQRLGFHRIGGNETQHLFRRDL